MMIVMKPTATEDEIQAVIERIEAVGRPRASAPRRAGDRDRRASATASTSRASASRARPASTSVVPILKPYKLASSQLRHGERRPSSRSAAARSAATTSPSSPARARSSRATRRSSTADVVRPPARRCSAAAPTSRARRPYAFQGLGQEGLRLLAEAKERTGLPIVTELMDARDLEAVPRSPTSSRSARATCRTTRCSARSAAPAARAHQARPVEHARGADHGRRVRPQGGQRERHALRARHPHVRDGLPLHARPHGDPGAQGADAPAGDRRPQPRRRAGARSSSRCRSPPPRSGADGIIVEVHPEPDEAICDGPQQLRVDGFADYAAQVEQAAARGRQGRCSRRRTARRRVRVAVLGIGLIGGSVGLAARERLGAHVVGWDPDPAAPERALARGAIDEAAPTLADALAGADVAFVAAPVDALRDVVPTRCARRARTAWSPTSARRSARWSTRVRRPALHRRPSAGRGRGRGRRARARATCSRAPPGTSRRPRATDGRAATSACTASSRASARGPTVIDADGHDRLMAVFSHLPHVVANVLVAQAARALGRRAAPGDRPSFRDATRVAGANPPLWAGIYAANREALVDAARRGDRAAAAARATRCSPATATLREPGRTAAARATGARCWRRGPPAARCARCASRAQPARASSPSSRWRSAARGSTSPTWPVAVARLPQGEVALWVRRRPRRPRAPTLVGELGLPVARDGRALRTRPRRLRGERRAAAGQVDLPPRRDPRRDGLRAGPHHQLPRRRGHELDARPPSARSARSSSGARTRSSIRGAGLREAREPDAPIDVGNAGHAACACCPAGWPAQEGRASMLDGDDVDPPAAGRPHRRAAARDGRRDRRDRRALAAVHRPRRAPALDRLRACRSPARRSSRACCSPGSLADGATTVTEPAPSRDHTERMLAARRRRRSTATARRVTVVRVDELALRATCTCPGDPSSAAFLIAAGVLVPGRGDPRRRTSGRNWTRIGFAADRSSAWAGRPRRPGGAPRRRHRAGRAGRATSRSRTAPLRGTIVEAEEVPLAIDELPLVGAAGLLRRGRDDRPRRRRSCG